MTTAVDETLLLSWDTCDIEEGSDGSFEWEQLIEDLTGLMKEMGATKWFAEGTNMGWQHRSGSKRFEAETGQEFLTAFLPKTDCTFSFHRLPDGEKGFRIRNAHHDAPMGESYHIVPVEEVEREIIIPFKLKDLLAVIEDSSNWTDTCGIFPPGSKEHRFDYSLKDGHHVAVVLTWKFIREVWHLHGEARFFRPGDDSSYAEYQLWERTCDFHDKEQYWTAEIDTEERYIFTVKIKGLT
jgi:hypothetical protein